MAESKTLQLNIARVDGPVFAGEALSVTVPGTEGEMTLLPNHTPLMSALRAGTITIKSAAGDTTEVAITSGTLEVSHNAVTILI